MNSLNIINCANYFDYSRFENLGGNGRILDRDATMTHGLTVVLD